MLLKIIIVALLFIIFYCLGSAVVYLVRGDASSANMAKALTWRITLSLVLFLFLMLSFVLGWVHPHGVLPMMTAPAAS